MTLTRRQADLAVALFLAAFTAFRLWYAAVLPISEDEANYFAWARHLAWGYYDQGPLVGWLTRLGMELAGTGSLGVRLTAVLLGSGMGLVLYDFCRRVAQDHVLGLGLVVAANSTIFFAAASLVQTYDTHQAFFWLLSLHLAAVAVFRLRPGAWYAAGAAAGLAMLAKYSSVLLPALMLAFLAASPRHRYWLRRKEPWLAALIAAAVFAPNLWWNATHHWTAFRHTAGLATQDFNFTAFEFLGGQAGLVGPVFFVLLVMGLVLAWRRARRGDDLAAFLLWVSVPVLLLFLAMSVKSRVPANWPGPGYLGAMLAAGLAIKPKLASSRAWRRWAGAGLISGYAILAVAYLHVPILKAVDLPADDDPTAKLYGWRELGPAVEQTLEQWPGKDKPFLFGLRYQTAALTAYYTPGQPRVEGLFTRGSRLNAFAFWTDPCKLKGRDGLGVVIGEPRWEGMFREVKHLRRLELRGPTGKVMHRLNLVWGEDFTGCDGRPPEFQEGDCCPRLR
jgi:undecaprenyl-diphosphatase